MQHGGRCMALMMADTIPMSVTDVWIWGCIGDLYRDQAQLAQAEAIYRQILQRYETALGSYDNTIIKTYNHLCMVLEDQDRPDEAEAIFRRSLAGLEKALGQDQADRSILFLVNLNNFGNFCRRQGMLDEAAAMSERSYRGYEGIFGPDHISTLESLNNFGIITLDQKRFEESDVMLQQCLEGYKKLLGPDDPSTLAVLCNLGLLRLHQGRLEEAETISRQALKGSETTFGYEQAESYTNALIVLGNIGHLLARRDRFLEAEPVYQRAVPAFTKLLGPSHPRTRFIVQEAEEVRRRLDAGPAN